MRRRGAFASGCGERKWTKGEADDGEFRQVPLPEGSGDVRLVSAGSTSFAVATEDNRLFAWGDNRSGNLGLGERHLRGAVERPREVVGQDGRPWFGGGDSDIAGIGCTRGQPFPKNNFPDPTGQVLLSISRLGRAAQCKELQYQMLSK